MTRAYQNGRAGLAGPVPEPRLGQTRCERVLAPIARDEPATQALLLQSTDIDVYTLKSIDIEFFVHYLIASHIFIQIILVHQSLRFPFFCNQAASEEASGLSLFFM